MADTEQQGATNSHSSFMLLWNPDYFSWTEQERLETLASIEIGQLPEDQWSMSANARKVQVGDRVYLRKTGRGSRGIVAAGWVEGEVIVEPHWDGSARGATYAPLAWDSLVDIDNPLDLHDISEQFPSGIWSGMRSGLQIPEEAAPELERLWLVHFGKELQGLEAIGDAEPRADSPIERRYAESVIRTRRHQKSFRALLLRNREPKCQFDGCNVSHLRMLEAAHIIADSEGGESSLENGLLLCRNHHRALDVNLLKYTDDELVWTTDIDPF